MTDTIPNGMLGAHTARIGPSARHQPGEPRTGAALAPTGARTTGLSPLGPTQPGPTPPPHRAHSRRGLSRLSGSPALPGPAQAGRAPAPARRASPARSVPARRVYRSRRRARASSTRHLELQQLLGLLRRQLPLLRRRHFAAASDPPLRHSPELTSSARTSAPAVRREAPQRRQRPLIGRDRKCSTTFRRKPKCSRASPEMPESH